MMSHVTGRTAAWDCACGNGQVTKDIAPFFSEVYATDISEKQLANAPKIDRVTFLKSSAESTPFKNEQFDLITVGQALHWFNIPRFFQEARRVLKPGGVIAVWGYGLMSINPTIDPLVHDFYTRVIGPYWDPERKLVDNQYRDIDFPFEEIPTTTFEFSFDWTLENWRGYLSTWSSVQKFIKAHGHSPVDDLAAQVAPLWTEERLRVSFPLFLRLGRK